MGVANEILRHAYGAEWFLSVPNSSNCSGFLKSVGVAMGFYVPDGNADAIITGLEHSQEWLTLGVGEPGLQRAIAEASAGQLVVVGVTSQDYGASHGHVAILLPHLSGPHRAPLIFGGGNRAATSWGNRTLREVFRPSKFASLRFFRHSRVLLGRYD